MDNEFILHLDTFPSDPNSWGDCSDSWGYPTIHSEMITTGPGQPYIIYTQGANNDLPYVCITGMLFLLGVITGMVVVFFVHKLARTRN